MRVLLIDVNCKYSSTGKIVYDLFNRLKADGHEAAICYGRGELIDEEGIFKFGFDLETKFHALLTRVTGLTGCFSFFSTARLIKFIEKYKPDIIHIHELHAYFVNIVPLIEYFKKNAIPIIWTFHCEYMYTGNCGVTYDCTRFMIGCGKCPDLKRYPKTLIFDFTHHMWKKKKEMFDTLEDLIIVTPSRWLADRTKMSFLKGKKIQSIHNGIDTDIFKPCMSQDKLKQKLRIKEDRIVVSVASHIMSDSNKGAKHILQIAENMKEDRIHFILVGSDKNKIEKRNNITILPAISEPEKLAKLYSGADMFLICSQNENFPTTCLEAQCCGTPVCGFDVGGVRETIIGESFLCDYGDLSELEKKLIQLVDLKRKGKFQWLNEESSLQYGKNSMLNSYVSLYKNVSK